MKIEIDVKELATLLDYLKGQRESTCNVKNLTDAILQNVPSKSSEHFSHRT